MTSQNGVIFGGRRIIHPGGYDIIDASGMTRMFEGGSSVIMLGTGLGGEPGKVLKFSNPDEASRVLRGGNLAVAVDMAFSPVPEGGGGASEVMAIRVNPATPSVLIKNGISYESQGYGLYTKNVQVKLEDGTIPGTKKHVAQLWTDDIIEVTDNLGAILTFKYTGGEDYAVLDVALDNTGKAEFFRTYVGTDEETAALDLDLNLKDPRFGTIMDLVNYLSGISDYVVQFSKSQSRGLLSIKLDEVLKENIKSADGYTVMALKGDTELIINNTSSLIRIEVTGDMSNFDYTNLAGGEEGSAPISWKSALNLAKEENNKLLVILSGSEPIQAEADAHVQYMSSRENKKQLMLTGPELGETKDQVKARALNFNNSRVVMAYPGCLYTYKGETLQFPSYFTAAIMAGRLAGVSPSEPITFDYFNFKGLEKYLEWSEVEDLIMNGVAPMEYVKNEGFRLVQGITTYTKDDNSLYSEISVRLGADNISEGLRKRLEKKFVGKKGDASVVASETSVTTESRDYLEELKRDNEIVAYRNIIVKFVNRRIYVDYEVAPIEPINFILLTSHFVPAW